MHNWYWWRQSFQYWIVPCIFSILINNGNHSWNPLRKGRSFKSIAKTGNNWTRDQLENDNAGSKFLYLIIIKIIIPANCQKMLNLRQTSWNIWTIKTIKWNIRIKHNAKIKIIQYNNRRQKTKKCRNNSKRNNRLL